MSISAAGHFPISLTRTYRTRDSRSRAFGIGSTLSYDMYLVGDTTSYSFLELVLADGSRLRYTRTSPGTGFRDGVFEHLGPGPFHKSMIRWFESAGWPVPRGVGWELWLMREQTVLIFPDGDVGTRPEQAALLHVRDRFGNRINLERDANGNLLRVTSNDGSNRIEFTHDGSHRVTRARDNTGREVLYEYDGSGRLAKVTDAAGGVWQYTYDSSGRMRTLVDARGIPYLTNSYDSASRVVRQQQADGTEYLFAYTVGTNGRITQTDVTDPRGSIRRVTFNGPGYWATDTRAVGKPEQQGLSVVRDAVSNHIVETTDAMARRTRFVYDAFANVTSVTELYGTADAVTTSATYGPFDQITSLTNALQHTTTFAYDARGALTRVTDPLGHMLTATPDSLGQPIAVADAAGTAQLLHQAGLPVSVTDPLSGE